MSANPQLELERPVDDPIAVPPCHSALGSFAHTSVPHPRSTLDLSLFNFPYQRY